MESKDRVNTARWQQVNEIETQNRLNKKIEKEQHIKATLNNKKERLQNRQLNWIDKWIEKEDRLIEKTMRERSESHERRIEEMNAKMEVFKYNSELLTTNTLNRSKSQKRITQLLTERRVYRNNSPLLLDRNHE